MDRVMHSIGKFVDDQLEGNTIVVVHVSTSDVRINTKVTSTTRGYTWEVTVVNAESVDEAVRLAKEAEAKLRAEFGESEDVN